MRKFARALLTIAAGLLTCLAARADRVIIPAYGMPGQGFDNRLAAMYSGAVGTSGLASNSPFNMAGDLSFTIGLDPFPLAPEPLTDAAFVLPFNFSDAWVASFSNLNLPIGVYSQLVPGLLLPPDFRDWVAALPPDFEIEQESQMTSFNVSNSRSRDYWDLLREPLVSPDLRIWVAELPPAFEMARNWEIEP
ncbi:MAG: hypothetical protein WBY44_34525 [Bryobacteraceae bacterium]